MNRNLNFLDWATLTLVIIGALNWGLIGLGYFFESNWNLVAMLFGDVMEGTLEATVYLLVGLSGLYQIWFGYKISEME
ncbi:MAG: DUF378 domain-containing protein [Nanohaloarchaea archaeon]|nr:DUF378 domain-containing protein [Candidatus Nanohaloarchaea archaeon]